MPLPLRILLVEDSPIDAELIVRTLRRIGFAPEWERVECEADFIAGLRPDLDVILCDYTMPEFSAIRALEVLRERGLAIPVIIVSGIVGEEAIAEVMKKGAIDYLLKNDLEHLGPAIEHARQQA